MKPKERQEAIIDLLQNSEEPITGQQLADRFAVSRQIIVGDITKLKNQGHYISSGKKGYEFKDVAQWGEKCRRTIKVMHAADDMPDEVRLICENGAVVNNVFIIHPIYGRLEVTLMLRTMEDCERFSRNMLKDKKGLLCDLTNGIHHHVISAPTEKILDNAVADLRRRGFLCE